MPLPSRREANLVAVQSLKKIAFVEQVCSTHACFSLKTSHTTFITSIANQSIKAVRVHVPSFHPLYPSFVTTLSKEHCWTSIYKFSFVSIPAPNAFVLGSTEPVPKAQAPDTIHPWRTMKPCHSTRPCAIDAFEHCASWQNMDVPTWYCVPLDAVFMETIQWKWQQPFNPYCPTS